MPAMSPACMPSIGFAVGVLSGIGMAIVDAVSLTFGMEGMPGMSCFPVVSFIPDMGMSCFADESFMTGMA